MYDWEDLIDVYSEWRWIQYERAKKYEVFIRRLRRRGSIKLNCKHTETRLDFSSYAGLLQVIPVKDMQKLEEHFLENF